MAPSLPASWHARFAWSQQLCEKPWSSFWAAVVAGLLGRGRHLADVHPDTHLADVHPDTGCIGCCCLHHQLHVDGHQEVHAAWA